MSSHFLWVWRGGGGGEKNGHNVMAYLYCRIRTRIQTRIWTPKPNGYIILCRGFRTAWSEIQIQILTVNYRNGIGIQVGHWVCLPQCKSGFPLFRTDKIPWYFQFFSKFPGIFSLFLKYDFQVVLNINLLSFIWTKINHFNYTTN